VSTSTHVIPVDREVVYETKIVIKECITCGVNYGLGTNFVKDRRQDHGSWYCPNGHGHHFPQDNEAEQLRKQVKSLETRERIARDSERFHREQAAHERRSAAATRGHLTRLRKRIAAGVCPCCNRSFENVRRHIEGQHPTWIAEHAEAMTEAQS